MGKSILMAFLVSLFILGLTVSGYAQPLLNPVNGHYYEIVGTSGTTWYDANTLASGRTFLGMQGHLATITNPIEQDFIVSNLSLSTFTWFGGRQLDSQPSPDVGWYWITGETWDYTNWVTGPPPQPYDGDGVENNEQNCTDMFPPGEWDDWSCSGSDAAYLVEYETDNCVGSICYVPCDPMGAGCPESFCNIRVPSPIGVIEVGQISYLGSNVVCVWGSCPPGCIVFVPVLSIH
jgi:hypothetical protein